MIIEVLSVYGSCGQHIESSEAYPLSGKSSISLSERYRAVPDETVSSHKTGLFSQYAQKFRSLGIPVSQDEIFSSSFAIAMYLKVNNFPSQKKVYVIGGEGILEELQLTGFTALGQYTLDFTSSGWYMAVGGRKGLLGIVDMINLSLIREFQIVKKMKKDHTVVDWLERLDKISSIMQECNRVEALMPVMSTGTPSVMYIWGCGFVCW